MKFGRTQLALNLLLWLLVIPHLNSGTQAHAVAVPTAPILRVDTGMHTGRLNRMASDAQSRYLVTGAYDKTVRVWELVTGRLLRTLRPPIGEGVEGSISAVAMSPDGNTIACGGQTGYAWDESHCIYLFDCTSGQMTQRIVGLPGTILHLSYSPDGRYLAVSTAKSGIRFFRVFRGGNSTLEAKDEDYNDSSYSIEFSRDGRVATTADDGLVRLYDKNFKLIAKQKSPGGIEPWSARFSPDGTKVAVGFFDTSKVDVLSGSDLTYLFSPAITGVSEADSLMQVAWSADGRFLYAAGSYGVTNAKPAGGSFAILGQNAPHKTEATAGVTLLIRKWSEAGRGPFKDITTGASRNILHVLSLQNGSIAYSSFDPTFGIIDATDRQVVFQGRAFADYKGIGQRFLLGDDGTTVQFGYELGAKNPARFSLLGRDLRSDLLLLTQRAETLHPPVIDSPKFQVADWQDGSDPKLNGVLLPIKEHEIARCLAIVPDQPIFFLGTAFGIHRFNLNNDNSIDTTKSQIILLPSEVLGLNSTSNGRVVVAALSDGTIRWYKASDLQELLAFFPAPDHKRWVLWTPQGYYDTSIGGEALVGWHLNHGPNQAADFFPMARFRSIYYRPDVVAKVLTTLDEQEALRLANMESGRHQQDENILKILPPVITIVTPHDSAEVTADQVTLRYNLRSPSGEPITGVKALVDGRPAPGTRDFVLVAANANATPTDAETGVTKEITVKIPQRDCEVSLVAQNRFAASEPATIHLRWQEPNAPPAGTKNVEVTQPQPKLYVLAIGVSAYQDPDLTLHFSAKDATDFSRLMQEQKKALYADVVVKALTDQEATKQNILDGLKWIQKMTTSNDIAMVFLSGHGTNDATGAYFFVPQNYDRAQMQNTGLPYTEIKNLAASISGKALFFVDSCHAGSVVGKAWNKATDVTGMVNELTSAENGVIVFCASTGKQVSWEDPDWGNGAFTKALIEGLRGSADYTHKSKITINMINLYLSERVKELTQGRQTPTVAIPQTMADFPITVKK